MSFPKPMLHACVPSSSTQYGKYPPSMPCDSVASFPQIEATCILVRPFHYPRLATHRVVISKTDRNMSRQGLSLCVPQSVYYTDGYASLEACGSQDQCSVLSCTAFLSSRPIPACTATAAICLLLPAAGPALAFVPFH